MYELLEPVEKDISSSIIKQTQDVPGLVGNAPKDVRHGPVGCKIQRKSSASKKDTRLKTLCRGYCRTERSTKKHIDVNGGGTHESDERPLQHALG